MTWTKFGAEFRDECAELGLTDAEFRTHVEAIMYLYGIENMDMIIQCRLVRKWAGSDNYADAVRGLVEKGLWKPAGPDWKIVHHEDVFRQSLGYQLRERERAKDSMAKKRAAAEARRPAQDVTQDVTRNELRTQSVSQSYRQSSNNEPENERASKLEPDKQMNGRCSDPDCDQPLTNPMSRKAGKCPAHMRRAA
ncbi:hypothetical protein [Micropruina sp.]|uniref:hypothetical protein n=1 Tax=Micropruina sp. TaxID=2737536 RepID=UPI0039E66982